MGVEARGFQLSNAALQQILRFFSHLCTIRIAGMIRTASTPPAAPHPPLHAGQHQHQRGVGDHLAVAAEKPQARS